MIAIVFACTKFHYLIYGQDRIKVNTDHQPLVSVMKKEIHKIPNNRLWKLRLKLLLYNIDVRYLPGKYMYVTDYLSRNYVKREDKGYELSDVVHTLDEVEIQFKNDKENEFVECTKSDEVLGKVLEFVKKGWPKKCNSEGELRYYYKIKNELIMSNELIILWYEAISAKKVKKVCC